MQFRTLTKLIICLMGGLFLMTQTANAASDDKLHIDLSNGGKVVIQLLPDLAPQHVERIKTLAGEGFYDNVVFHRVIDGFMAQTGDPTGTGSGGSDYPDLPAEFTDTEFKRGTVAAARTMNPNSANSQFFICFDDEGCTFLQGQYTVWGQVVEGMKFVDQIEKGEPPVSPTVMTKVTVSGGAVEAEPEEAVDADAEVDVDAEASVDAEAAVE